MKNNSIFGLLFYFFFVREFQSHGSQHNHGLLWVANTPIYGLDSNNAIENFVDKYISCDNNKLPLNLREVQTHCHKKTCRKKNQVICRFNLSWAPMEKNKILKPFPMESLTPSKRVHLGEINKRFSKELRKTDFQTTSMSSSPLLKLLSIDKETYINALWVKIKKATSFLQRLCKDIWTNPFGIHVGNIWQANIDVQFILDPYVATSYCTSYLTKSR
jgi:hypothetical protein